MSSSPIADIERQIDHTRAELDHTIRALRVELSPRRRAQVAWRSAKVRTARSVRHGVNWAAAHQIAVGIGAAIIIAAAVAITIQRDRLR